jgi:YcxB-like protein
VEITLRYSVTRKDVNRLYWRLWRARLWKYHFGILAIALFFCILLKGSGSSWYNAPLWLALFVIGYFIMHPQLEYKPQTRMLVAGEAGIHTAIGASGGSLAWADVLRIDDAKDAIYVIRTNLNSFVIPDHAFASGPERTDFLEKIHAWHEKHSL